MPLLLPFLADARALADGVALAGAGRDGQCESVMLGTAAEFAVSNPLQSNITYSVDLGETMTCLPPDGAECTINVVGSSEELGTFLIQVCKCTLSGNGLARWRCVQHGMF